MSIKIRVLGGGGYFGFWGGGSADFIFMGARIFLKSVRSWSSYPTIPRHDRRPSFRDPVAMIQLAMIARDPVQKNPRVHKIRVRNSGAGNGCVNFMDAWKNCVLSAGKTHVHKNPRFGWGGYFGFFGGGGECPFYFYGREDFSEKCQKLVVISNDSQTRSQTLFSRSCRNDPTRNIRPRSCCLSRERVQRRSRISCRLGPPSTREGKSHLFDGKVCVCVCPMPTCIRSPNSPHAVPPSKAAQTNPRQKLHVVQRDVWRRAYRQEGSFSVSRSVAPPCM